MQWSLFKLAIKVLLRRKFFTAISLFGIAFTLTVLIVATAFYDNSYRPHAPESRSDRFLVVWRMKFTSTKYPGRIWTTYPGYKFLKDYVEPLAGVGKMSIHSKESEVVNYKDGRRVPMMLKRTDGHFWDIMNFEFVEGRPYRVQDEENRNFVAVINEATRDQYFGGQPAVGQTITADNQSFKVVGVVRNVPEYRSFPYADVWVPISTYRSDTFRERMIGNFFATILVDHARDKARVKAALAAILPTVPTPDPDEYDITTTFADSYWEIWARKTEGGGWADWSPDGGLRWKIFVAAGVVLLFMLLPVVNLVNINVSRIMERTGEIGVRKAFGATSWDLIRQFLMENLVLTAFGALLSLGAAQILLVVINRMQFMPYAQLQMNTTVFVAGLGFCVFFGLISGVYPAWRMSKTDPAKALKGGLR